MAQWRAANPDLAGGKKKGSAKGPALDADGNPIPDPPKRPVAAYMLFCNAKRAEVRAAHPEMKV